MRRREGFTTARCFVWLQKKFCGITWSIKRATREFHIWLRVHWKVWQLALNWKIITSWKDLLCVFFLITATENKNRL